MDEEELLQNVERVCREVKEGYAKQLHQFYFCNSSKVGGNKKEHEFRNKNGKASTRSR